MTDIEKRRLDLLSRTRNLYNEKNSPPAIHPRYRTTYQTIYGAKEGEEGSFTKSFWIRLSIAVLTFLLCFAMDYFQQNIGSVDSNTVIFAVQQDLFGK